MRIFFVPVMALAMAVPAGAEMCGPQAPAVATQVHRKDYDSHDAHRDAWKVCALTAADLTATEIILAGGGQERTPLLSNRAVRVGVGAIGCVGLHALAGKDPEKAKKIALAGLIVRGLAAAWNIRQLTR